jgi:hypothetical protein
MVWLTVTSLIKWINAMMCSGTVDSFSWCFDQKPTQIFRVVSLV